MHQLSEQPPLESQSPLKPQSKLRDALAALSSWAGFSHRDREEGGQPKITTKEERLRGFCYKHAQVLEVSDQEDMREVEFQILDGQPLLLKFGHNETEYSPWLQLRRDDFFLIPVEDLPQKVDNVRMSLLDIELLGIERE